MYWKYQPETAVDLDQQENSKHETDCRSYSFDSIIGLLPLFESDRQGRRKKGFNASECKKYRHTQG
jgi:hypothetical protein